MSQNPSNHRIVPDTLPGLLHESVKKYGDVRAVFAPHEKPVVELTYKKLGEAVAECGAGLLRAGLLAGDHVALFSDNRPQWLISDLAITGIGAVDVPRGSDTSTAEFEFILEHSECSAAFLENEKLYGRLVDTAVFQKLKFVVLMDDSETPATGAGPEVYRLADILELGRGHEDQFITAGDQVAPSTMATIVYTSGTTGSPKGVVLTHQNLMTQPLYVELGIVPSPGDIQISILPSWHAYERATEYFGMFHGSTITYSDKRYIRQDLVKLCPHLLPCVPRIWESVYQGIQTKLSSAPDRKQKLFRCFSKIGLKYIVARRKVFGLQPTPSPLSFLERLLSWLKMALLFPAYKLGDLLIFSKVRSVTGGRLRAAVSGGGSFAPYLDDFFELVGIPILNGYGLTETSPVLAVRTLDHNVRGSVGRPMPHTEISIRDDKGAEVSQGETGAVWAKGPQIMTGYYKNPEASAKVITEDGWFITGDIGWLTSSGDLVVTGRAKDTIVLSSGENVEPEPIEDACRKSKLVQQIMLVGSDQKTLGALVAPEYLNLAEALGISSETEPGIIIAHENAAKLVKQSLSEVMQQDGRFKQSESISKVHLLAEPFNEVNGMMTSTMKIKKNVVYQKYKDEIAALFGR